MEPKSELKAVMFTLFGFGFGFTMFLYAIFWFLQSFKLLREAHLKLHKYLYGFSNNHLE